MTETDNVQRELSAKRETRVTAYADDWNRMIREWRAPRSNDALWLLYAANYLFNTGGVKWAVDPARLGNRVPEAPAPNVAGDLRDLAFALLTHAHIDHADIGLWHQLQDSSCHWIVPEHLAALFLGRADMGRSRHSIAVAGTEMVVCGVRILPFDAPHYALTATGTISRVPATGYWIETANGSYLLPGDVRTYDPTCLQPFADVSAVLAHVFLGRSAALDPTPPLLDAFVRFHLACHPRKLVLTHLHEFGREPADCWRTVHAQMLQEAVAEADKTVTIVTPEWYRETAL